METDTKLKWSKNTELGSLEALAPVLQALLKIVEFEKQKTLDQLEQFKKMVEKVNERK